MEDDTINPGVEVIRAELFGLGQYRVITSVNGLAEALLYDFPEDGHGEEYHTALMACLDCMHRGDTGPEEVRVAFVAAARESGVTVLPDDAVDARRTTS